MLKGEIFITKIDQEKLLGILSKVGSLNQEDRMLLKKLGDELARAHIVEPCEVPRDVVTMNSTITVEDVDSGHEDTYTIVYPGHANYQEKKISILAPIGTALLGYRAGDVIEWEVPRGVLRLKVKKVLYQPESKGRELS